MLLASSFARVQPEGVALALVLWCTSRDETGLAGILIAATTLPQLVTGPLVGRTLDRSPNPAVVVALAGVVSAVACLALAVADLRPAPSIAAALVLSISAPALTGGLSSLVMGWSDDHAALAAWDSAGYNVAGLLAPIAVTVAAARHPPLAFVTLGTASLVVAAVLAAGYRRASLGQDGEQPRADARPRIRDACRALASSPPLRAVTIATTMLSAGLGGFELALASAIVARGVPAERVGVLAIVIAVGALSGSLLLTQRGPRLAASTMTLLAVAASGTITLAMAVSPWPAMVGLAAAFGLIDAPLLVGTYRARTEHSPPSIRAGVFTVAASAKLGAGALGALGVALVTSHGAGNIGLVAIGVTGLVGAGIGARYVNGGGEGR